MSIDISNDLFLQAIFGDRYEQAWVTGFKARPKDAGNLWGGGLLKDKRWRLRADYNTFFCLSLFGETGNSVRRRKDHFISCHAIMVDDIGTKIDTDLALNILPEPSWSIETSAGNYQYGYILAEPVLNPNVIEHFQSELIKLGLSADSKDPGMFGVTRYCRLPVGSNTKKEPFQHVVASWQPDLRYTIDELFTTFGINPTPPVSAEKPDVTPIDDAILEALQRDDAVKSELNTQHGYSITCPWVEEHTDGVDTGTAYFPPSVDHPYGGFKCHHGHCDTRTARDVARHYASKYPDLAHKLLLDIADFAPIEEPSPFIDMSVENWLHTDPLKREWVFTNIMPLGKVCLLVASGGTGKSYITLQMALSIATGEPLCGMWLPEAKGSVLAVYAEEDREELHRRFRAIQNNVFSQIPTPKKDISDNLFVLSAISKDKRCQNRLVRLNNQMLESTNNVDLLIAHGIRIKERTGTLRMIILDPMARFHIGNENDASQGTQFMEVCEHIARELNTTVLFPHHVNKITSKELYQVQGAARGTSAFTDAVRWQANMRTMHPVEAATYSINEDMAPFYVQLAVTKNNYGTPIAPVWLRREVDGTLMQVTLQKDQGRKADNATVLPKLIDLINYEKDKGRQYTPTSFALEFGGEEGPLDCGQKRLAEIIRQGLDDGALILETSGRKHVLVVRV